MKQVKSPFSKASLLSDLQRRGRRGKKQHTSSPQSQQSSFTPNCSPSLTSGPQLDRTAAQHPPGWEAFCLPPSLKSKGKAALPKAENKALHHYALQTPKSCSLQGQTSSPATHTGAYLVWRTEITVLHPGQGHKNPLPHLLPIRSTMLRR